mgnify:CR=1 FL=1
MAKFQQKHERTESNQPKTPEEDLWTSVLSKAAHDAIYSSDWFESRKAIEWFKANRADFKEVCKMAGRNPDYVHRRMKKPLVEREAHMEWVKTGSRYYVKNNEGLPRGGKVYHSHYRMTYKPHSPRGRYKRKIGRPRKKDPYYVSMGKLGGRPRMYNVV